MLGKGLSCQHALGLKRGLIGVRGGKEEMEMEEGRQLKLPVFLQTEEELKICSPWPQRVILQFSVSRLHANSTSSH